MTGVLTAADANGVWAWTALRVDSVPAVAGLLSETERRAEASAAEAAWLHGQWEVTADTRFELRYLSAPGGPVTCAVLARTHGPDEPSTVAAALRLREALGHVPPHARSQPVEDPAEVDALRHPFDPAPDGLAEIRKPIHAALPTRPDAGAAFYLAVTSFPAEPGNWGPFWAAVAAHPAPVMLSVGLAPVVPPPQFGMLLADLAARYAHLAAPGRLPDGVWGPGRPVAGEPFAAFARSAFTEAQRRYVGSRAFRARFTLASPAPLPAYLVDAAATAICPPRADSGRTHVVVRPWPEEAAIAARNLRMLEYARWDGAYLRDLPARPPDGLRLLAELVDAAEAASGWKFPLAAGIAVRPVTIRAEILQLAHASEVNVEGDSFSNIGAGAIIVNRSTLTNSLNSVRSGAAGPETAAAIESVAKVVADSGNQEAADNFNDFTEELSQPQPRKSRLKSFWNGVVASLGPITEVARAGETIRKLFE